MVIASLLYKVGRASSQVKLRIEGEKYLHHFGIKMC